MVGTQTIRSLTRHCLRCACRQQFTPPHSTTDKHSLETLTPPKHNFTSDLAKWENALKPLWIYQAREGILESHAGKSPKILDPFRGGGSIPLEAQWLGCETYSCDLNPVAVLIQKCALEYAQKYGQRLYDDVQKWGHHLLTQITGELSPFYSKEPDGSYIYAYIWAYPLPCQNLNYNVVIPLPSQFWLAQNSKRRIALFLYEADVPIASCIVGIGHAAVPDSFAPTKGTVPRAVVTCPLCSSKISANQTRSFFQDGLASERMIALVTQHPKRKGKQYRLATDEDSLFSITHETGFLKNENSSRKVGGFDSGPDELTPRLKVSGAERRVSIHNYNLNTYGDLFNAQQQSKLVTLTKKKGCEKHENDKSLGFGAGVWDVRLRYCVKLSRPRDVVCHR